MNKFSSKSQFLKAQAISLHQAGHNPAEVSRLLNICRDTAYRWLSPEYNAKASERKRYMRQTNETFCTGWVPEFPTVAFVPRLIPDPKSRYRMAPHG